MPETELPMKNVPNLWQNPAIFSRFGKPVAPCDQLSYAQ